MPNAMYYRISDPLDVRDLSAQMAAWTAAGNPKASEWAIQSAKPSPDAVWTSDATWVVPPAPTYTPEHWTARFFTAPQILALQRFEFALAQAGQPLGTKMAALKQWLETMLLESADPTPRTFSEPPYQYAEAAQEAIGGLQSP